MYYDLIWKRWRAKNVSTPTKTGRLQSVAIRTKIAPVSPVAFFMPALITASGEYASSRLVRQPVYRE
jgi:hypothetical protein